MAERVNLTKTLVEKLPTPDRGRTFYQDTKVQGLGVRVTPSGTKTFVVYRKIAGHPVRITLGRHPDLTVEKARQKAKITIGQIADGIDPKEEERKLRSEMTLNELFEDYLERHAKQRKRTWDSDARRYNLYLKPWGGRRISAIARKDVHTLHAKIGREKGPYAANRLLSLLSKMFNLARVWGYEGENPVIGIERFREAKRERFLHPHELPKFFAAIQEEPNTAVKDYVLLSLLTGARKGNVLSMRWEEVDWDRGVWVIPSEKSKNQEKMEIPLHSEALTILKSREGKEDNPWVFPGTGKMGHLQDPKKGWQRILKRCGLTDLRLHDLRRTLGSWQAARGASLSIIGKSLGHRNVATTAIYSRLDLDPVRESVNGAVDDMLKAAFPRGKNGEA